MEVLNSILPVFMVIIAGRFLYFVKLTGDDFLQGADRLTYYFLFPVMLFWKTSSGDQVSGQDLLFSFVCIMVVFLVFLLGLLIIRFSRISRFQAGSFLQSCFRFNTYVGMALVITALSDECVRIFSILIGFVIPFINVISVVSLIAFSNRQVSFSEQLRFTMKSLFTNPLIIACFSGMAASGFVGDFPGFMESTFRLISYAALPVALVSIGGGFSLKGVRSYMGAALGASAVKLLVLPAAGFVCLQTFGFSTPYIQTGMVFFSLPCATSIYILSSQLNSDTELASATIVLSTLLSFFTMSAVIGFI
mgnify:CR=1 FL=1